MTIYTWIPFFDSDWVTDSIKRNQKGKLLPFADGHAPFAGHEKVTWGDIQANDILYLAAHGRKWTTEYVTWNKEDGTMAQWTAAKFAEEISDRLGERIPRLDYRLLACFGANNITRWAESFGSRLAKAMSDQRLQGTLTAYKGATGMIELRGKQAGSSRITCALSKLRHGGLENATKAGKATDASAKVWNL